MYIVTKLIICDNHTFRMLTHNGVLHSSKESAEKEAKALALKHKTRYSVLHVQSSFSTQINVTKEKQHG
jgi:hypothetical protein